VTYGESLFAQRELCELVDGEIIIRKLPKRMTKKEGLKYYNKKLRDYWRERSYGIELTNRKKAAC